MSTERDKIIFDLGSWLSSALEDDYVCKEFKDVINAWFELPEIRAVISNYEEDDTQNMEYY